jgi:tetratricopeptide (TPR) repeat protein
LVLVGLAFAAPAGAAEANDCFGANSDQRIKACSELIDTPGLPMEVLSHAYAMRALAYSLQGEYQAAIGDYDHAIALVPNFPVALNNRAWAYFRWGKLDRAAIDVDMSLRLDPTSPHALDTRAHVNQWNGEQETALRDYDAAMAYGGETMVKLYQCGLRAARVYNGPTDGVITTDLRRAFQLCVAGRDCDPLPPDEDCRQPTS